MSTNCKAGRAGGLPLARLYPVNSVNQRANRVASVVCAITYIPHSNRLSNAAQPDFNAAKQQVFFRRLHDVYPQ